MAGADYSQLATYFSNSQLPSSKANDIAKFILLNADVKRGNTNLPITEQPSLMSRIFDVLSRPRYAVANVIKGAIEHGDLPNIRDAISGLSGTQKTSFTDVLKSAGAEDDALTKILGLGLDIGADPINFIPVGVAIKSITALSKGTKAAPKVTSIQKLLSRGEPINPENFGLPVVNRPNVPVALNAAAAKSEPPIGLFPRDALATGLPKSAIPSLNLPGVKERLPIPTITTASSISKSPVRTTGQIPFRLNLKARKPAAKSNVPDVAKIVPARGVEFEPRHAAVADEILSKFDPSRSTAVLNKAHPDSLNAKQQVWLYYRALDAAKRFAKKPEWVASHANKIYASMEDSLRTRGFVPRIGSGENISLYDTIQQAGGPQRAKVVLDYFAKDLKPDSPIWGAIQGLRAAGAVDESKSVKLILDKITQARTTLSASGVLSDAGEKAAAAHIVKLARQAAKVAPISPASEGAAFKLINQVIHGGKTPAQVAIEQKSAIIDDLLAGSIKTGRPTVNHAMTVALEKSHGTLPRWAVDNNKAIEFLMSRVATWWGQKDLRPLSLVATSASSATAAARGKALNTLFKGFDESQRIEAITVAQGFTKPTSIHTARLADEIFKMMSNLTSQVGGASVLTRSAIDMDMLNKWMRSYGTGFEFTRGKKVKDITGSVHDFSNSTDWLNSWKIAEIKGDPEHWLFRVNQAMEQATREKALFDELGERFGQKIAGGGFTVKIEGHVYLEGYYFPRDVAQQIPRVVKDWTNPVKLSDPLMRHYDRLLSMWKSGVTIYRPGHHIRNLAGDAYLGWMDGVNTIKPYMIAARVQRTLKDMYPTLSDIDRLVELGVASKNLSTPRVGETIFRNKSGVPFTAQQIAAVSHQKGLLEHARTIEDIIDLGESTRWKPFGGRVQAVGRAASELISHNSRLAHFIDKVMKSRGSNLEDIFEQASRRARRWHPTGLDLTEFERKVMRRIIPFYSWLRKSTPLLLEGLVMNPGKVLVAPKIYGGVQQLAGIQTSGISDPFPTDQMFPAWLRGEGLGPLGTSNSFLGKLSNQDPTGYVMAGQGLNPLTQLMSDVSKPGHSLLGSLTPMASIPLALASGQNLSTGMPISGIDAKPGAMQEYLGSQIPIWSAIQGVAGVTPFGTETKKGTSFENFINWLTGAGVRGTGPYIGQAKYEKEHPLQVQRAVQKKKFLEQLKEATQ